MASDLARRWLVPESFRRGYENGGALQNMAAHPEYDTAPGIWRPPKSGTAAPIRHLYVESSSQIGQFEGEACGASRSS